MKTRKYQTSISVMVTDQARKAVEKLAWDERIRFADATREILDAGIKAKGLATG